MERKKILDAPRVMRRAIVADADNSVAAVAGDQLVLPGIHPFGYGYSAWAIALTGWVLGPCPPCSGIWEYRIDGNPDELGRLWFERAADKEDGRWFGINLDTGRRNEQCLSWHSTVAGTTWWRGLSEPCPDGYKHKVPGASMYRVPLL
jgi:hypothetical protein